MRVLFVCTANICRSRAAEDVFRGLTWSVPGRGTDHEVRSAGTHASEPGTRRLAASDLEWADVVPVMEEAHLRFIQTHWPQHAGKVRVLDVPDVYHPDQPALRDLLVTRIYSLLAETVVDEPPVAGAGTDPPAPDPARS